MAPLLLRLLAFAFETSSAITIGTVALGCNAEGKFSVGSFKSGVVKASTGVDMMTLEVGLVVGGTLGVFNAEFSCYM